MESIKSYVNEAIAEKLFTGVSIYAEKEGRVFFEGVFGDTGSKHIKLTSSHLFDLASLTKLFTSTAILHLISMNELSLQDTLIQFFPEIHESLTDISVYSLLTHSSGLHYWYPFYTRRDEDFFEILSSIVEEHPLKERMIYSDLNFMLLGRIIEKVCSCSLDKAVEELVIHPLRLQNTTWHPAVYDCVETEFGNRIEMDMVAALSLSFDSFRPVDTAIRGECDDGNGYYYFKGVSGHAGLFSNGEDVCRLARTYLYPRTSYLSPELADSAMRAHIENRGLGFQLGDSYPFGGCGHTGFTGTYLYLNRKNRVSVSILTNRLHTENPRNIGSFRNDVVESLFTCYGLHDAR